MWKLERRWLGWRGKKEREREREAKTFLFLGKKKKKKEKKIGAKKVNGNERVSLVVGVVWVKFMQGFDWLSFYSTGPSPTNSKLFLYSVFAGLAKDSKIYFNKINKQKRETKKTSSQYVPKKVENKQHFCCKNAPCTLLNKQNNANELYLLIYFFL